MVTSVAAMKRSSWRILLRQHDLLLALLIVAVIALMILPLPPFVLDTLIALNLSLSVILLMVSLYIGSPLGLSTFPSLLLFTTLFRLSLNIAATRQILLHARCRRHHFHVRQPGGRRRHHRRHRGVPDHRDRAVHRHRQGRGARGRSRRALHARCHARQADEHRRRPARRAHRQGRGTHAAQPAGAREPSVRRDGRRDEVRQRRRHRRLDHRSGQHHRRPECRHACARAWTWARRSTPIQC